METLLSTFSWIFLSTSCEPSLCIICQPEMHFFINSFPKRDTMFLFFHKVLCKYLRDLLFPNYFMDFLSCLLILSSETFTSLAQYEVWFYIVIVPALIPTCRNHLTSAKGPECLRYMQGMIQTWWDWCLSKLECKLWDLSEIICCMCTCEKVKLNTSLNNFTIK